jgi:hypothetical protein
LASVLTNFENTKNLAGLYVQQVIQLLGLMVGKLLEFMNGTPGTWKIFGKVLFVSNLPDSTPK